MIRDALPGRLVLVGSAYAPAAIIVGCRAAPHWAGWAALAAGGFGLVVWALFLWWLPRAQPRKVRLDEVNPIDSEVTGYVASYLLPIVAAGSPSTGDIVAYTVCAVLLLIVAFAADLGAVNPVIYLYGLRVIRAEVDGRYVVILAKDIPRSGSTVTVTRALGIVRLSDRQSRSRYGRSKASPSDARSTTGRR